MLVVNKTTTKIFIHKSQEFNDFLNFVSFSAQTVLKIKTQELKVQMPKHSSKVKTWGYVKKNVGRHIGIWRPTF